MPGLTWDCFANANAPHASSRWSLLHFERTVLNREGDWAVRQSEQNSCCLLSTHTHTHALSLPIGLSLKVREGRKRERKEERERQRKCDWAQARFVARLNAIWDRAIVCWVPVEGVLCLRPPLLLLLPLLLLQSSLSLFPINERALSSLRLRHHIHSM